MDNAGCCGPRLKIVGIGGTLRAGSTTERALIYSLRCAEQLGAAIQLFGGEHLARLPIFDPRPGELTAAQVELVEAVRTADGVIIGSPGYHGSISGIVKNALDTLEFTAKDAAPYLHGRAVGTVAIASGWQAAGSTLSALRGIIHALRGWPTPFGAALNSTDALFDEAGACRNPNDAWALSVIAEQVVEFANMQSSRVRGTEQRAVANA